MIADLFKQHIETMLLLKNDSIAFCAHVTNLSEPLTALQFLIRLNELATFWNTEQNCKASNSALRRWIEQGGVLFNREKMEPNELLDFSLFSLVLFPKSEKKRITLL